MCKEGLTLSKSPSKCSTPTNSNQSTNQSPESKPETQSPLKSNANVINSICKSLDYNVSPTTDSEVVARNSLNILENKLKNIINTDKNDSAKGYLNSETNVTEFGQRSKLQDNTILNAENIKSKENNTTTNKVGTIFLLF